MDFLVDDYILKYKDVTLAINEAISDASKNQGRVIFSANHSYIAGTIILKSNVSLYFEKYSILKMTDDRSKLLISKALNKGLDRPSFEDCEYDGEPKEGFIRAVNVKNITIEGDGIIDGSEENFYGKQTKYFIDGAYYPRVPLIFIKECENVKILNITLRRSAFWTVHLVGSRDILIDGIHIFNNLKMANCDGIDPDHCKNLIIRNCYIEAADDGIVFKCTRNGKKYGECQNVEVYNCTIISTSAGIKFGTESVSDFIDFNIHDIRILRSNRGISFQLRDEGNIKNVKFSNITMDLRRFCSLTYWGKAEPIAITCLNRFKENELGIISNISFDNISADTENGIFIYTNKYGNISDISLNNISLYIHQKSNWEQNTHDLRPAEGYGIIEVPLNALLAKGAKNLAINKFSYRFSNEFIKIKGNDILISE